MKKFTLIEADRYISIDGVGIFFPEDKWPFADIEHLWAIQWKDDGTPEGTGEVEYDSPVPNTPATKDMLTRYVEHFNEEHQLQLEAKRRQEEEEANNIGSWQQVMQELEERMESMQQRHEDSLKQAQLDADRQVDEAHRRIAEAHESLFYSVPKVQEVNDENEVVFEDENSPSLVVFDAEVDPGLFEDVIEEVELDEENFDDGDDGELMETMLTDDFSSIDLSLLEDEFKLELLFDEDPTEQIVPEIEELISDSSEEDVPNAEIPD